MKNKMKKRNNYRHNKTTEKIKNVKLIFKYYQKLIMIKNEYQMII